jgi:polysaccharide export outer membrane protein
MKIPAFSNAARRLLLPAIALMALATGCVRNRDFVLVQPKDPLVVDSSYYASPGADKYRLQPGDALQLEVKSLDENVAKLFQDLGYQQNSGNSMQRMNMLGGQNSGGMDIYYLTGYILDDNGRLELPVIGKVGLTGLTLEEAKDSLQRRVDQYFKDAFVLLRFGGTRFTVLGETRVQGNFNFLRERVHLLHALAMAGDFTPLADRKHVQLIRQYPGGSRVEVIDFTRRELLNSPHYFLRPDDILYVPPLRIREVGAGASAVQNIQLVSGTLSTLVSLYLLFVNLTR